MSEYDVATLKSNFDAWCKQRAEALTAKKIDPFEYFCIDQFLKFNRLTDEEIERGCVGKSADGGADGFFYLVNQKPVNTDEDADSITPDDVTSVTVAIFQIKKSEGFNAAKIDKHNKLTADLLDFKTPAASYIHKYHQALIDLLDVFKGSFLRLTEKSPPIKFDYYYITLLDNASASIHPTVKEAERDIGKTLETYCSLASCEFHYIDAAKLLARYRLKASEKSTLTFAQLFDTPEGYIGLAKLSDYYTFLKAPDEAINLRFFESNVRGFQQNTEVNRGIRDTLLKERDTEFWLLNNGITILATTADTKGYNNLEIGDAQVVNGLQTSREVFAYFKLLEAIDRVQANDNRRVLVRVVRIKNDQMRESIVRATNSQNPMTPAALRSTDDIHGHIEDLFVKNGLYYDRRPGHHKDTGVPIDSIISIVGLLQAVVAIVLAKPHDAYGAPGQYIKQNDRYESVFGEGRHGLTLFLKVINIQRRVDSALLSEQLNVERSDRLRIRLYVSTYVARGVLKKAEPNAKEIELIVEEQITESVVKDSYKRVYKMYKAAGGDNRAAKGPKITEKLQRQLRRRFPMISA